MGGVTSPARVPQARERGASPRKGEKGGSRDAAPATRGHAAGKPGRRKPGAEDADAEGAGPLRGPLAAARPFLHIHEVKRGGPPRRLAAELS